MYDPADPQSPIPHIQPESFFIEAVVICDKYSDYLAQTLPTNKFIFDNFVVVTSPEDVETRKVCEYNHVKCVPTDNLRSRWGEFCKGCGINVGLQALKQTDWVVHMDADIYLPPQTKELIRNANLDKTIIYGTDRHIVQQDEWARFREEPLLQHENGSWIHVHHFPIGTRVMFDHAGGYVPLGFFQLWNPGTTGITDYPDKHNTAGRTDTLHAMRWPRNKRSMIPEIVVYHLETPDAKMSSNWAGRTTTKFSLQAQ